MVYITYFSSIQTDNNIVSGTSSVGTLHATVGLATASGVTASFHTVLLTSSLTLYSGIDLRNGNLVIAQPGGIGVEGTSSFGTVNCSLLTVHGTLDTQSAKVLGTASVGNFHTASSLTTGSFTASLYALNVTDTMQVGGIISANGGILSADTASFATAHIDNQVTVGTIDTANIAVSGTASMDNLHVYGLLYTASFTSSFRALNVVDMITAGAFKTASGGTASVGELNAALLTVSTEAYFDGSVQANSSFIVENAPLFVTNGDVIANSGDVRANAGNFLGGAVYLRADGTPSLPFMYTMAGAGWNTDQILHTNTASSMILSDPGSVYSIDLMKSTSTGSIFVLTGSDSFLQPIETSSYSAIVYLPPITAATDKMKFMIYDAGGYAGSASNHINVWTASNHSNRIAGNASFVIQANYNTITLVSDAMATSSGNWILQ